MQRLSQFLFCLLRLCPNIQNNLKRHYFFLFWLVLSFPKFYLQVRFWSFEDKLQLMETFSGQNFNIFEISPWKQASGVIFVHINNLWRTLLDTQACNSDFRLPSFRSYFLIVFWSWDCHVTTKYLVAVSLLRSLNKVGS